MFIYARQIAQQAFVWTCSPVSRLIGMYNRKFYLPVASHSSCKLQCIWQFKLDELDKFLGSWVYLDEFDKFSKNISSVNVFINLY